ncbi:MAG: 16S rRNA (cytidine(1402)-2'-O)-methyltransferase [Neisseriaceae bacterium]|nr:16S rRNA (cytidine(1402)-2'-O)-methyltransferase [Neisseriaceae bacterium]
MQQRIATLTHQYTAGTLYVLATPIGNLGDLSLRALAGLQCADIILAEDTRVTGQLLAHYNLSKKMVSLREHNEREMAERVIEWLQAGQIVVQVSDAGTPSIADPGARLADSIWRSGLKVSPIPGPCAMTAVLSSSGLDTSEYLFAGFLSPKSTARQKQLVTYESVSYAVVCYEAPHRILETVSDIVSVLGATRLIVFAREITKNFETIVRLPAADLLAFIRADSNQQRGECVLVIAPMPREASAEIHPLAQTLLMQLVPVLPTKQVAQILFNALGGNKNTWYELALALKQSLNDSNAN